jgi:hypothetical protein
MIKKILFLVPNIVKASRETFGQLNIKKTVPIGNVISFDDNNQLLMEFSIEVCILNMYFLF